MGLFSQTAMQSLLLDRGISSLCRLKSCAPIVPRPRANLQRVQIRTPNLGSKHKNSIVTMCTSKSEFS